jgi:hypothetical protein
MVGGLEPPDYDEEQEAKVEKDHCIIFVLDSAQLEVAQVGKVCPSMLLQPSLHLAPQPTMLTSTCCSHMCC